jgi:hypothetical protein
MMWFLLFILSFGLFAQTSYVPLGQVLNNSGYEFSFTAKSWVSRGTYDTKGDFEDFDYPNQTNDDFRSQEMELKGMYGATKDFQFLGGINYRQNQSRLNVGVDEYATSNSGVQSYFVGAMFALDRVNRVLQYSLELNYRQTPYRNERINAIDWVLEDYDRLVLGDDGSDISAGINMSYISPYLHSLGTKILYRKPGTGLSDEINYQVEAALVNPYAALVVGCEGIYSLKTDQYTENEIEKPITHTGATALYNSINRERFAPYVGLHLSLGKTWRVESRAQVVSSGRSTDEGYMYSLTVAKRESIRTKNIVDKQFKTYDLEANVTKISKRKEYVVIDKGLSSGISEGMRFDLFVDNYTGGNKLMARGVVVKLNAEQAILKVTSRFSGEYEFKEGMVARGFRREVSE